MYLHTKSELSKLRLSNRALQTDRQMWLKVNIITLHSQVL